jgi:tRNA(Ile)-lysidine synthase
MVFENIQINLLEKCQLDPQWPVVVGVSGGPDSLCLLDVLARLVFPVVVAHLDHGLRPESQDEAKSVREIASRYGLPFVLGQEDVQSYARTKGLSMEEAARAVRYEFLFSQAELHKAQAVAVGHNADDQVETVLMHLLRGAGPSGLGGMEFHSLPNAWSRNIALVRPLLNVWREEIEAYLAARELKPAQDLSNQDVRFYRNRLRHELIPFLESYNPRIKSHMWQTAEILRQENGLLDELVNEAWAACAREQGGAIALRLEAFKSQPLPTQRRLLRRAIAHLRPGLRDVDYAAIQRALDFVESPSRSGQADLITGLLLKREGDRLWLTDREADLPAGDWPQIAPGVELSLEVPGAVDLSGGWRIAAEPVTDIQVALAQAAQNSDPYQAWLDLVRLQLPLKVRARRPGERFRPLGMGGHSLKISDLMINAGMERRRRAGWPLLVSGDGVVWVPGVRVGEKAAIGESSQRLVRLSMYRPPR